jgi:beta-N-acetylhexosaminidase
MRLLKSFTACFFALSLVFSLSADEVAEIMQKMSLRDKICQLFVISPEYLNPELLQKERDLKKNIGLTELTQSEKSYYKRFPAGGFVIFAKNIIEPEQLAHLTEQLHSLTSAHITTPDISPITKPLIFVDEEGGKVARIANNSNFDVPVFNNMLTVKDSSEAFKIGQSIGEYLSLYDIDVDFAPVADVNTNPENPVIGERAFSSNPITAGKLAFAMYDGLASQNVGGCLKHYPGHGDTKTDTHLGYAETTKTWQQLLDCELLPFIFGINNSVTMIMTAHISVPAVTNDKTPASLSSYLIDQKLRTELHYDGLIITDSLSMKAITSNYSSGEAAVQAFLAGNDFLLLPEDYEQAFSSIYMALKHGLITEERLNESVERIIRYKLNIVR